MSIKVFIGERSAQLNELFSTDRRTALSWVDIPNSCSRSTSTIWKTRCALSRRNRLPRRRGGTPLRRDRKALCGSALRLEDIAARHMVSALQVSTSE